MKKLKLNELNRAKIEEYSKQEKFPVVIVLDNIRSAMNVGSFFRTADGFGIEKIYICGISACPPHKEISKTAIGADHSVEWEYVQDIFSCVFDLKDRGYGIIGIEQTDTSVYLNDFFPGRDQKYAFIFGNEVEGISEKILELLDIAVEIPQFGTKHSFNVAVAGGIVLWDYVSKILD
ncbi:MAG: RNA methyltransferase [Saprospiraceae bacterium]|nr:RNA methyltransferase [Saprospiraceae bacterium]